MLNNMEEERHGSEGRGEKESRVGKERGGEGRKSCERKEKRGGIEVYNKMKRCE